MLGPFIKGERVELGIELKSFCFDTMINYQFSQKLKLLENNEFNHLTIILILPLMCGPILSLITRVRHVEFLTF